MNLGKKTAVVIKYQERPIFVIEPKEYASLHDYLVEQKEAEKNREALLTLYTAKFSQYDVKLASLEKEVVNLKLEIALDRGEITEEEYERCKIL